MHKLCVLAALIYTVVFSLLAALHNSLTSLESPMLIVFTATTSPVCKHIFLSAMRINHSHLEQGSRLDEMDCI
jgi:hypothetical protein